MRIIDTSFKGYIKAESLLEKTAIATGIIFEECYGRRHDLDRGIKSREEKLRGLALKIDEVSQERRFTRKGKKKKQETLDLLNQEAKTLETEVAKMSEEYKAVDKKYETIKNFLDEYGISFGFVCVDVYTKGHLSMSIPTDEDARKVEEDAGFKKVSETMIKKLEKDYSVQIKTAESVHETKKQGIANIDKIIDL